MEIKTRSKKGTVGKCAATPPGVVVEKIIINRSQSAVMTKPDGKTLVNNYIVGDNIELMGCLSDGFIDMIYMDPPYNTGRDFHYFDDSFGDTEFFEFLMVRLKECHRVLSKTGNIIIHVEPRISHRVRLMCDDVFGVKMFRNEIVWHTGGNAKNKRQLGRNHDTLIVYGKKHKSKIQPSIQIISSRLYEISKVVWTS